jgi:hypothetical protein
VKQIVYRDKYKYQLQNDYIHELKHTFNCNAVNDYIVLLPNNVLTIKKGYAWDGPSGPSIDTKNFMRGSIVHDALYQLMREGLLPNSHKDKADKELQFVCLEDGMSAFRAFYVYQAVKYFGKPATDPGIVHLPIVAP